MSSSQSQLPPFRIRQLSSHHASHDPASIEDSGAAQNADGLVRIRRHSYDNLLVREPQAALTYTDNDDNEQVTVGSGFELSQRLSERFSPAVEHCNCPAESSHMPNTHAFDIKCSGAVKEAWQPYVTQTLPIADADGPKPQPTSVGSLTPLGRQQVERAAACLFRASRNPSSSSSASQAETSPHTSRWASYSSLPTPFSSSRQEHGHGQLAEMPTHELKQADQKPLLALFESELAKLSPTHGDLAETVAAAVKDARQTRRAVSSSSTLASATTSSAAQTQPNYQSSQTQTRPAAASNPRELIESSFQSLSDGIKLLASSTENVNSELRQIADTAPKGLLDFVKSQVRSIAGGAIPSGPAITTNTAGESQPDRRSLHKKKAKRLLDELQSFLDDAEDSSENCTPVAPASAHPSTKEEELVDQSWESGSAAPTIAPEDIPRNPTRCSDRCLYGCDNPSCAVKSAVKEAYERLFDVSTATEKTTPEPLTVPQHFKVDKLLARRYISYDSLMGARKKQYLVRWVDRGSEEDVWYDVESLVHCKELVYQFDRTHPEPELAGYLPTPPLQSVAQEKELAQLHSRAADRMVTFQPPQASHHTHKQPSPPQQQQQPQPSGNNKEPAGVSTARAVRIESEKPKPIWAEPRRDLLHRRSWHPLSKATVDETSFDFSPMDVMKKYPPVTHLFKSNAAVAKTPQSNGPPMSEKPSLEKDSKTVTFSSAPPYDIREAQRAPQPLRNALKGPLPSHETDPSLYAPPSPVLVPRSLVPKTAHPVAPSQDAALKGAEPGVRRVQSLSFRPPTNTHPDERMSLRRDRFAPYAETRSRNTTAPAPPSTSLRRANTTAAVPPSAYAPYVRRQRSEEDTRRNNVAHCTFRLAEMGFSQREAAVVSETVSGDLESALDILNEDGRVHDEFQRRRYKRRSWAGDLQAAYRMPGAFD